MRERLDELARLRRIFGGTDPLASLMAQREENIRVCAYFKSERRDFAPGHAVDDWLEAELEIDAKLRPM